MSGFLSENVTKNSHKSAEWYTPSWVFEALGLTFDLDPSSPHDMTTAVPAETKYTIFDDGLKKEWFGRVWMNPPYGKDTPFWMRRMIAHNNGIALVFSRTDAEWCQEAMKAATAILFMSGRIQFVPGKENQHKKSRCGAGTVLFAFGEDNAKALERMSDRGVFINKVNDKSC
ncbi:MAG: adenine methyltransferase [Flavobacteriaceae bacterium]|nr:adenine methyltransferase [Flavobacteriaceae bacterium]|tara:strand:+ start:2098 stop:2613 length:516 start_codon:yes stop_codon:yes gene_type:complete